MAKRMLFNEVVIGNLVLKNRVVMAPMCTYEVKNKDGILTDFHKVHYGSRALGGVGLINIEATAVEERGRISVYDLGLYNDIQADKLKELVDLLHKFNTKVGIQLAHAGRKATGSNDLISASSIRFNDEYDVPRALEIDEIKEIVNKFITAAKYAKEAGIDVIEIHAAHGYLLNQFLSPLVNRRNDQYGGSLENRFRFLKEVIEGIKEVYEGNLWVRISADEYHEKGNTLNDFIQICKWMKELKVDLVDVSGGGVIDVRPFKIYAGYQVERASILKKETGVKVGVVGLLNDAILDEFILENGMADVICLGRPLLYNPNWLYKAAEELKDKDGVQAYNETYERGRTI